MSEYWITETSQIIAADGDVGDKNHIIVVMERLWGELVDDLKSAGISLAQEIPDPELLDPAMLRQVILDWADGQQRLGMLSDDDADDPYAYLCRKIKWKRWKMNVAVDDSNDGDGSVCPRAYAMKEWGWIRVADNSVTLHKLDRRTLRLLADGLAEIDEDFCHGRRYNIEVRGTSEFLMDVRYATIETLSPARIRRSHEDKDVPKSGGVSA